MKAKEIKLKCQDKKPNASHNWWMKSFVATLSLVLQGGHEVDEYGLQAVRSL
jgi:hypothetical protein